MIRSGIRRRKLKIQLGTAALAFWCHLVVSPGALVAAEIVGPDFVDVAEAGLVRFHTTAEEGHTIKWVFVQPRKMDCQRYTDKKGRPCILFAVPRQPQTIRIMLIDAWSDGDEIRLRETLVALVAGNLGDRPASDSDNVLDVEQPKEGGAVPNAPSRRPLSVSPPPITTGGETGDRFTIFWEGDQKYVEDSETGLPFLVQDDGSFRIGDETFEVTE